MKKIIRLLYSDLRPLLDKKAKMINEREMKKALDPCYKIDNVRYIGKGPWEYELSGRVCVGKRVGDTITYKTRE